MFWWIEKTTPKDVTKTLKKRRNLYPAVLGGMHFIVGTVFTILSQYFYVSSPNFAAPLDRAVIIAYATAFSKKKISRINSA